MSAFCSAMTLPVWKSIKMKPLAATLGAGGITTAAEAEKKHKHKHRTMLLIREPKYVFGLNIKLPFLKCCKNRSLRHVLFDINNDLKFCRAI